ncbi:MAG: hypothetical protein ACI8T1_003278 [Verrucomicrobiales bacterium]|jgi:hypothetical protein
MIPSSLFKPTLLALIGFAGLADALLAQDITLVRRFAAWNDPVAWSDGAAAGAGKAYVVDAAGQDLTSPRAFSPAFRGNSLDIQSGGNLDLRHFGGAAGIADLTLSGGAITHGAGRTVGVGGLNDLITVSGDSKIVVVRTSQTLEVQSRLSGTGGLTAEGASVEPGDRATIALLGVGTDFSGDWNISNVSLNAVTPDSLGSGNVLITEGTLDFDYRYNNPSGTLTIQGGESRLLLNRDIAFGEVFFGQTKLPDGVHPWSFFDELGAGEQIIDGGGRLIIGDQDADDDGMPDVLETEFFGDMSKTAEADEDGDGLTNGAEVSGNSDPTKADTDEDSLSDSAEIAAGSDPNVEDTDGDGVTDQAEVETELTNPRSVDTDGDSVSDGDELTNGTKPLLADTDADGFDDGTELAANSDPNNAEDKPSGSFIPAQVEVGAPVLLEVRFGDGDPIGTKEANMALNTDEPEILFVTTASDGTGLTDPITGEDSQQAVVGFFMDPRTLEQTRDPFVILGNPDGELRKLDVKYNPLSKQYVVATAAQSYRPSAQVVPLIALVNPNSVAGAGDPVAKAFTYNGDTALSYDDVAVAVSTNNGNILLVAEFKFAGEGEGVVGAMFDKDGNVLTPEFTRLDRLQAVGDEDDPDVLFLPNNDAFVFLVNTDGDAAPDLLDRITGSIIQGEPDADGKLQLGAQVVLGADRKEGVAEGHAAAIENPFTNELIGALDYNNGADGGDIFYFEVGPAPEFEMTTTRDQIPYLEASGSNPYQQRHPQLAADPNSGVIVVGHHVLSSAADPPLPNGYALTVLGPDGAVLPGRDELNNGFHAFLENEAPTNNDANWTNVKYDPLSDSFIVVFADNDGETKVVRFTVVSNHLEQPSEGGGDGGGEPVPDGSLYSEDFEGLTLGENVDEGVVGEMVWTNVPPADWTIDNSNLFGADEEGVGVTEWKGWTFADKDWWIEAAEDQRRSEWLSGKGTVAIADPDEWDDLGGPGAQEPGGFNTFMTTPTISLEGLPANTAVLSFDSSWRPEFDDNYHQSGNLTVTFDGGEPIELFEWLSDPGSPNFKGEAIDERAIVPLNNPEGATSMVITFGMFDAGNDWWWAIDNIDVSTGSVLSKVAGRRSNVLLEITDTGSSKIDAGSVILQIDGQAVEADVTKDGGVVRIEYQPTPPFIAGSQHAYVISAKDEAGSPVQFEGNFDVPVPLLPEDALAGPAGVDGEFGVRYIYEGGTINSAGDAIAAILAVADGTWEGEFFDTTHAFINHGDSNGLFPESEAYPEEAFVSEDFVQFSKGTLRVPESGEYTFGVQTDDGFALRILGAEFSSVQGQGTVDPGNANTMAHPGTTGNSSTRGTVTLTRGDYDIEFLWFERGGGDFGELYIAKGSFDGDGETDTWQLVGKPEDGETAFVTLVGSPLAIPDIVDIARTDTGIEVDFTTPAPDSDHEMQQSVDLLGWNPTADAVLTDVGDGLFRFGTALPADPELFFRVAILPPPPLLASDFENGADGWTAATAAGDTLWELGTPNAGGLTTAASGTSAWGTAIAGNYGPGTVASLQSPVIDLAGVIRPKLSFNYFIDSTLEAEGGQLRFLDEAGEVLFTRQEIFSGQTDTWTPFVLTLPREVRDLKIIVEFRFLSDGDGAVGAGWYIDDVVVDG